MRFAGGQSSCLFVVWNIDIKFLLRRVSVSHVFGVPTNESDEVDNKMTIAQEEIFGPVLSIIPYNSEEELWKFEMRNWSDLRKVTQHHYHHLVFREEAIRIANDTVGELICSTVFRWKISTVFFTWGAVCPDVRDNSQAKNTTYLRCDFPSRISSFNTWIRELAKWFWYLLFIEDHELSWFSSSDVGPKNHQKLSLWALVVMMEIPQQLRFTVWTMQLEVLLQSELCKLYLGWFQLTWWGLAINCGGKQKKS